MKIRRSMWKPAPVLTAILFVAMVGVIRAAGWPTNEGKAVAPPPSTRVDNVREIIHGVEIADPYRWLEDQESPETRAWIDAQNKFTDSTIKPLPGRNALERQLAALLKVSSFSLPLERGGRYFFTMRLPDQDQAVLYYRQDANGANQVLVDPLEGGDHTTTVNLLSATPDGKLIAYAIRNGGKDEVTPHLIDVDSRKLLPDAFPETRYFGFFVLPDKSGVYYSKIVSERNRVFFHRMGSDTAQDAELFGPDIPTTKILSSRLSEDGRYLVISVVQFGAGNPAEIYVKNLATNGPIVPITKDLGASFQGDIDGDHLFVRTNWKAPHGRVLEIDLKNPAPQNWKEIIPESPAILEGLSLSGGKLAVRSVENVVEHLKVYEANGKLLRTIPLPAIGSIVGVASRSGSDELFYEFESFHIPPTIYRDDAASGKQEIWAQRKVPMDSSQFEVKQVWYTSKDGTRVPMFLAYRKGIQLDGSHPVLLTGYGGFDVSELPGYRAESAAWIANGGVYALANLRGGSEFGEEWHRAGMMEKKQNVFDDFIAAAEWLVRYKYTRPERLAIRGTSNGGLLVGAALTQRPELFGAVVCGFPLLDMVRYHKFLVARWWVPEYGSSDNPEQFKFIYAYSPYHHVKAGTKYPAVLFVTGDSDTRVAPLHARKMTALLQAASTSGKPVLLHYDTHAGHSGGVPVGKQVDDLSDEMSFLYWQLGISPQSAK
ncbi:MAG TPA: prolyl oligopeptidase family serine peptidase [Candidatus Acidoferrales bacterium]|nr:prolyl oligopeptidase family serine peptidase [Candidatus Acidoferrales bacterium]